MSQQIPDLQAKLVVATEKIEPILAEVGEVRAQIPAILQEVKLVREQVPPILEEVRLFRQNISPVLEEIKEVRALVPDALQEFEQIRQTVPLILTETEKIRQQVPLILEEVGVTRDVVKEAVREVALTRESLPLVLEQTKDIVSDMKELGKKASEGAVSGVFSGLIKAPFSIVGDLGKSILKLNPKELEKLTELDKRLMAEAMTSLATREAIGETRQWNNKNSRNKGTISLKELKIVNQQECPVFEFFIRIRSEQTIERAATLCLNQSMQWEVVEPHSGRY